MKTKHVRQSMKAIPLLAFFFFGLEAKADAHQDSSTAADRQVDAYLEQQMAKYRIPGLSLMVLKDGKILKSQAYGRVSVELDIPASENTVYHLASVTKLFTGIAVMLLVEDGKLSLDASVTDLIDTLPPAWNAIQVRHLLTHTSGMRNPGENPAWAEKTPDREYNAKADEVIRTVAAMPLAFKPGDEFAYNQAGYVLLGMIIEKLSGKPYADFLAQRVFKPLRMEATAFGDTSVVIPGRLPTTYNRDTGKLRNWVYQYPPWVYPAAGLNSSTGDLGRMLLALESGKLLKPGSIALLWTPVTLNSGKSAGYALGWDVNEHRKRKVVGHEGGGHAWVAHFPKERLSIIALCNLNGARADSMQYGIADFYLRD
jgi:CubicO group peptidase (beta-lactamase class C family)